MELDNMDELIKNIKMYKIASSNITALGYDESNKLLRVIFKNNSSYIYTNVEPDIWQIIINSESKGRSLNENIVKHKEKYKYYKLT